MSGRAGPATASMARARSAQRWTVDMDTASSRSMATGSGRNVTRWVYSCSTVWRMTSGRWSWKSRRNRSGRADSAAEIFTHARSLGPRST